MAKVFLMDIHEGQAWGFSLVELLVAMALGLLILTGLSSTFLMQNRTYDIQQQVNEMMQTTRASLDMIGREVRMAGYDPARAGIIGITYDTARLKIKADLNGDRDTNDANETITYQYYPSSREIYREESGISRQFATNVTAFTFDYLDAGGAATTTSANIRQVRLSITTRTEKPDYMYAPNNGFRVKTLTMAVTPPNLAKR